MTDRPQLDLANYLPYLVNRLGGALVADMTDERAGGVRSHHRHVAAAGRAVLSGRAAPGRSRRHDQHRGLDGIAAGDAAGADGTGHAQASETSNREVVIELTAKGRAQVERIIPIAHKLEQMAAAGVPAKDMAVVKRSLRRMYENIARQGP